MPLFKNCVTCDLCINFDKDEVCICDKCCLLYHSQCSGLSRSDIQLLLTSSKQRPAFHCNKCISEKAQMSDLLKTISDLQAELHHLKQAKEEKSLLIDDVVNEINDRKRRENNIIIYGLEESSNDSPQVKEILKVVAPSICTDDIGIIRLGKSGRNRPPPVKVVLHKKDDVLVVLRNKRNLKTTHSNIAISTDNTKVQQEHFRRVRAELEQRKMKGHVNIRSIRKNFLSLKDYIIDNDSDIIGVSETFLDASYVDKYLNINNYNLVRSDRLTFGGGVAIYLKSSYTFQVIPFDDNYESIDHLWLMVTINKLKVVIGVIYVQPSANIQFFNDLTLIIEQIYLRSQLIILMGDLNVNLLCKHASESKRLLSLFSNFDLVQLINEPTRITPKTASLLDVICVTNSFTINSSGTFDLLNNTDHLLTFCNIGVSSKVKQSHNFTFRNFKKIDIDSFVLDAERINWQLIDQCEDLNKGAKMLNDFILELFDLHAPFIKITPRKNYKPYITHNIIEMIRLRNKAHRIFLKKRTEASRQYYCEIRNYVKSAITREKKAFVQYMLNSNKSNSRKVWYHLQQLGVRTKKSATNEIPASLQDPATMNEYFLNIAGDSTIDLNLIQFFNSTVRCKNASFTFNSITEQDIYSALKNISSKAFGPDNLNITMIILIIPHCLDSVLKLFNNCLRDGIFPQIWKIADILPLAKVANPTTYNDLRPISLLSPFAKIFEKILAAQITKYLEHYSIIPANQSAYRKKYVMISRYVPTILILLDQSRAFDLVNHQLLVAKLRHLGFDNSSLTWFQAYLNDRFQRVSLSSASSSYMKIDRGVPQGSVLGPLLFSVFTYDSPTCLQHLQYHLYADDLQLYMECNESNVEDLLNMQTWCEKNGLKLNPMKSTAICVGPERKSDIVCSFQLTLMNDSITWSNSVKNLGLTLDTRLSFSQHRACYALLPETERVEN
ncbi:uncharacterized protein LOC116169148 [Photinus pyralis]|uniref:uncharacterized protein LOC116169148 n=1 Tax=Photinus pyralis TaxID=7054 RepID=UPI001267066C|nr:uncharacterized protein LOC116169148 [Photinus pyralis]